MRDKSRRPAQGQAAGIFAREHRGVLAGTLLFGSVLLSLGSAVLKVSPLPAGLLQLAMALLLFSRVAGVVRLQSVILSAAGGLALWAAGADGSAWLSACCKNQGMIAMLAAVGFLRLVPFPDTARILPTGRRAIWQSLFGVHWLGSFTNIAAMVLFGDRMAGDTATLKPSQAVVLLRGFALAALWSPFFVAMGVALNQAPAARLGAILLWGLPVSQLLLALLAWQLGRQEHPAAPEFSGYPFTPATMAGPLLLAGAVFAAHLAAPGLSIVSLVTLIAPLYALLACWRRQPLQRSLRYIRQELPRMGPEVLLFQSAGILGVGLTMLVLRHPLAIPATVDGAFGACLGLGAIILLATIGIHPIVGITVIGTVLSHLAIAPTLLALSFLMGWGLGVIISPISGTNLLLSGRYGIPLGRTWRWHARFVGFAYLLCCTWLQVVAHFV